MILKCDDDIWNWRDFKNGWFPYSGHTSGVPMEERKKACAESVFDRAMKDSIELFKREPSVGCVSYFYGQMMFHTPGTKWVTWNCRPATVYMTRAELLAPPRQAEIHQFEEFYTWYNMRKLGYVAPRYGLAGFHIDGNYAANSGGLQDFNRKRMTVESMRIFKELYPGEMVYKKDNGDGGFFVTHNTRKIELCKAIPVPDKYRS